MHSHIKETSSRVFIWCVYGETSACEDIRRLEPLTGLSCKARYCFDDPLQHHFCDGPAKQTLHIAPLSTLCWELKGCTAFSGYPSLCSIRERIRCDLWHLPCIRLPSPNRSLIHSQGEREFSYQISCHVLYTPKSSLRHNSCKTFVPFHTLTVVSSVSRDPWRKRGLNEEVLKEGREATACLLSPPCPSLHLHHMGHRSRQWQEATWLH